MDSIPPTADGRLTEQAPAQAHEDVAQLMELFERTRNHKLAEVTPQGQDRDAGHKHCQSHAADSRESAELGEKDEMVDDMELTDKDDTIRDHCPDCPYVGDSLMALANHVCRKHGWKDQLSAFYHHQ